MSRFLERREDVRIVATEYLYQLVTLMQEQDFTTAQLARGTGVPVRVLESPEEYISTQQYHLVVKNALRLSRDPLLGFKHGLRLNISSHGFLGFAMMASETLGTAFSLAVRYARIRTQLAHIRFITEADSVIIQIQRDKAIPGSFSYVVHNIIAAFLTMARFLTNNHPDMVATVKLTESPLTDIDAYERLLNVQVFVGQQYNQILFPSYLMDLPVSTANTVARRKAEMECEKQLSSLRGERDIVSNIRSQIDMLDAFPTLPVMATYLNTSPRTLNRKLAQLNTTYQQIIDEQRHFKAITLLGNSELTIEEIAVELGYNDTSNFGRAFKRWQGMTPRQYRQSTRNVM